jgi:hypothetical protein
LKAFVTGKRNDAFFHFLELAQTYLHKGYNIMTKEQDSIFTTEERHGALTSLNNMKNVLWEGFYHRYTDTNPKKKLRPGAGGGFKCWACPSEPSALPEGFYILTDEDGKIRYKLERTQDGWEYRGLFSKP